jgi:error-prone DNA polymerase
MSYVELHCKSNFSFLEGASHADELLQRAAELGYAGLAITDRNSLAGIVRAHTAAKDAKLQLIVGAELHPIDGPPLVVWPPAIAQPTPDSAASSLVGGCAERKGAAISSGPICFELNEGLLAGLLLRQPVPRSTSTGRHATLLR